jgi:predicted permease
VFNILCKLTTSLFIVLIVAFLVKLKLGEIPAACTIAEAIALVGEITSPAVLLTVGLYIPEIGDEGGVL